MRLIADAQQAAIAAALELAYAERPPRDRGVRRRAQVVRRRARVRARERIRHSPRRSARDHPDAGIPAAAWRSRTAIRPARSTRASKTFYAVSPIPKDWTDAQVDSFLREYNTRSIHNLTIHEAMPGPLPAARCTRTATNPAARQPRVGHFHRRMGACTASASWWSRAT